MPLLLTPATDAADGGPLSVDLTGVLPAILATLAPDAVRREGIRADEKPCQLGELFHVAGSAADGILECRGDFTRVHCLGARMTSGTIRVRGSVGRHAGEAMTGGRLEIEGDAGDWLAAEMAGGRIRVTGRAGDNVGGSLPGSEHGLRGGLVTVAGDVGSLAGVRMRRGLLAIGGGCGEAAGFEMRSGLVIVGGRSGPHPGLGMRRGSLVFLLDRPRVPATFRRGAAWNPPYLPVLFRRLARARFPLARNPPARWRQWHGDPLDGGRGEILHPEIA